MHIFTTEDLLQYLYNETSPDKTTAIKLALESDWSLLEKMEVLKASHQELNSIKMVSPSNKTLDKIYAYAEKSVEELSEKA
ncbi:MAG: hypothetical protein WD135_09355 [Ferruginibacter sp.]